METIKSYLLAANTTEEFRNSYIKSLASSGPIQRNRAIALKRYLKSDPARRISQVDLAKKRAVEILKDVVPCSFEVHGRKKSFLSYAKKILKNSPVSVRDLYGFRIILDDTVIGRENAAYLCYDVAKWLIDGYQNKYDYEVKDDVKTNSNGDELDETIRSQLFIPNSSVLNLGDYSKCLKNYILFPKETGYQGLHFFLYTENNMFIEVQIRTWSMHLMAEYGIANHKKVYKPEDCIDAVLKTKDPSFIKELLVPPSIGERLIVGQMPSLPESA